MWVKLNELPKQAKLQCITQLKVTSTIKGEYKTRSKTRSKSPLLFRVHPRLALLLTFHILSQLPIIWQSILVLWREATALRISWFHQCSHDRIPYHNKTRITASILIAYNKAPIAGSQSLNILSQDAETTTTASNHSNRGHRIGQNSSSRCKCVPTLKTYLVRRC